MLARVPARRGHVDPAAESEPVVDHHDLLVVAGAGRMGAVELEVDLLGHRPARQPQDGRAPAEQLGRAQIPFEDVDRNVRPVLRPSRRAVVRASPARRRPARKVEADPRVEIPADQQDLLFGAEHRLAREREIIGGVDDQRGAVRARSIRQQLRPGSAADRSGGELLTGNYNSGVGSQPRLVSGTRLGQLSFVGRRWTISGQYTPHPQRCAAGRSIYSPPAERCWPSSPWSRSTSSAGPMRCCGCLSPWSWTAWTGRWRAQLTWARSCRRSMVPCSTSSSTISTMSLCRQFSCSRRGSCQARSPCRWRRLFSCRRCMFSLAAI